MEISNTTQYNFFEKMSEELVYNFQLWKEIIKQEQYSRVSKCQITTQYSMLLNNNNNDSHKL